MKELMFPIFCLLYGGFIALYAIDILKKKRNSKNVDESSVSDEQSDAPEKASVKKAGVGKSKFSIDDVRRIAVKASENAVNEIIGEMDIEDVEFDVPDSLATNPNITPLTSEEIQNAFETDDRIADEISDADDSVATPGASGCDFDELARAELILGRKTEPTTDEHKYVVRVFANFKNTELMDHIPKYILDKLEECQRKVEAMTTMPEPQPQEKVSVGAFAEFAISDFIPH
ncbi:MAG: hypothetical protein NC311_19575 [Muribaculaceae bacterium]|nr:hypothetical protein [Muribaculaceae bacterium]